jgi:very-short-patch-repair endonuclease
MTGGRNQDDPQKVDGPIAALAGRQHGVVSLRQLRELGFGDTGIEGRLRRGTLLSLHRGVYAAGHRPVTIEARWMAGVLACGPEAVLSHRSAAQLWRLQPRSDGPVEVTRPGRFRPRAGIRAQRSALPDDEVEKVDGIPVTGVSRTIFDLAGVVTRRRLVQAMNEAAVLGLTDRLSLPDLLDRYPRRRGSAVLRAILEEEAALNGVTKSELEERFLALLEAHGLPRPRLNASVSVAARFLTVDCLWEDERLIVELDGRAAHATAEAFEVDRERDRLLVGGGWRVVRLTWRQLRDESPSIAVELRRLLVRAVPVPG